MGDECCENCRFWVRTQGDEVTSDDAAAINVDCIGFCKRLPPAVDFVFLRTLAKGNNELTPISDRYDCTIFPVTWADDWCGEYKPKALDNPLEGKA